MMAAVFEKTFIQNLQGRLIIRYCPEIVFSKDNLSNEITVKLYNGESEYSGGGTVSATVIRADGRTVPLTGTITGNVVSLALIESCMEVPGQIQIFIRLTSGNVKTTVFAGVFTAVRTETDSVIDPGTIIPSVTDLINQIDAAIDSIPADYSTLLGSLAGTYSASKTYAVGDYVWYDGALYRCTTAITTAESWTAAHWSRAVLGDDVTSLKSAVTLFSDEIVQLDGETKAIYADAKNLTWTVGGVSISTGATNTTNVRIRTGKIDAGLYDSVVVDDGYGVNIYCFGANDEYLGVWTGTTITKSGEPITYQFKGTVDVSSLGQNAETLIFVLGVYNDTSTTVSVSDSVHFNAYGGLLFENLGKTEQFDAYADALENLEYQNITPNLGFVLGKAWSGNVGYNAVIIASTYRISNLIPILLKPGKYAVTIASGYRISYRTLNASNVIQADSGWKTTSFEITIGDDGSYYAFTGGKTSDAAVTLEEFLQNVSINVISNLVETVNGLTAKTAQAIDKQDALAVISFPGTGWAEVDTSAKTLTFPADTSIFANNNPNTRYNFQSAQTISLASSSSSIKIIFNPSTLEFSTVFWSTKIPDGCLLIGYYNSQGVGNLVISCRYKINGYPYGVNYRNILCATTPPQAQPYVEFKTTPSGVNAIFPADFSIFSPQTSDRYYTSEAQTLIISSSVSTLQKIYFDPSTGVFATKRYAEAIPARCYLIATIRTIPCTVTISCPYMVDGKMYNISTASKEDQIVATANVKAVNHRGYNSVAPENTLPAFKLSKQNGFRYVETDVRFTSDNVPVLLHDTTINRTARNADGTEISGTINIADITYEQASAYDFGIWKGASYAGTKIPTLAEFMNLCRNIGLIPRVELNVLTVANAQTMFDVINSYGMARKVEYNCNNIAVAQKFLELEPSATIVYGMGSYNSATVTSIGALKTANNTIIINMYYTAVSAELIAQCKQYGIELEIWVTDSESVIKNLDPFISGVSSDHVNASVILYNSEMT